MYILPMSSVVKERIQLGPTVVQRIAHTNLAWDRSRSRCGMDISHVKDMLSLGRTVHLGDSRGEHRSYFLFFEPSSWQFFVAIVAVTEDTSAACLITVLDLDMYENDKGRVLARTLEEAASLSISESELEDWRQTFDFASHPMERSDLSLHLLSSVRGPGDSSDFRLLPIGPVAKEYLSGGKLQDLGDVDQFWRWANGAVYEALKDEAARFLEGLTAVQLRYRERLVVAEFCAGRDDNVLRHFLDQKYSRKDLTLFLQFAYDFKLHELQKAGPSIPADLLYAHALPALGSNEHFLQQIIGMLSKAVPPDALRDAVRGLTQAELNGPNGLAVKFLHDDDRTLIDVLADRIPTSA